MAPTFSIVIPCYNYGRFFERALASVFSQTDRDFEVIAIDDGSTDGSYEVLLRAREGRGGQLRVLRQENRGPSAVRNRGAREASGKYLVFLDADDELEAHALATFRRAIEDANEPAFVVGGFRSVHPSGGERLRPLPPFPTDREARFLANMRGLLPIYQGATALRRDVVLELPFEESFRVGEDVLFVLTLLARHDGAGIASPVLVHHKHPDSLRYQVDGAAYARRRMAELLFSGDRLPTSYARHRKELIAMNELALTHTYSRVGRPVEGVRAWTRALGARPRTALSRGALREVARCVLQAARVAAKRR